MTSISTMGQANEQISRLKNVQAQLATLQSQIATGKKTQLFTGLGTDLLSSKRARANLNMLERFNNNISIANRRIKLMQNGLDEIKQQAGNLVHALEIQTQQGEFEMETVGDLAGKIRDFMVSLLNDRDGQRYLFGGAETLQPPVTDTGRLDTYLQTQINGWVGASITTDEFLASYRDSDQLTDGTVGYSPALSSGQAKQVYVRVEEHAEIDYTVFANDPALRDLLTAAAVIENIANSLDEVALDPDDPSSTVTAPGATQSEQNDNFFAMFNDVAKMINQSLDSLDEVSFRLSQSQAEIIQIKENHQLEKKLLLDEIGEVEDIDLNEASVKLTALQIQLEASFSVTASIRDLRLANFL